MLFVLRFHDSGHLLQNAFFVMILRQKELCKSRRGRCRRLIFH